MKIKVEMTDRELRVLIMAASGMARSIDATLDEPPPTWTKEQIRNAQYDMTVLVAALNRLEAEQKKLDEESNK
jgi:hypothetical protein